MGRPSYRKRKAKTVSKTGQGDKRDRSGGGKSTLTFRGRFAYL
jgi:hypothetical protein